MKNKIKVLLIWSWAFCSVSAQNAPPQGIVYQAVARDKAGVEVASQQIGVKFSIHKSSAAGSILWEEEHKPVTNQFGLFTLTIGQGTPITGSSTLASFSAIPWNEASYFLEVFIDAAGGSNYISIGTTQFMSVPYALYAFNSGSSLPGPKGDKGDAGAAGPQGLTGAAGPKGDTGDQGLKGDRGEKGEQGADGPKGETGAAGPKGDNGEKGETGPGGAKGEPGIAGAKGDPGDKGETGADGPKGEKGEPGTIGAKGEKGEPGANGAKGETGLKGDKGDNGVAGKNGISITWKGSLTTAPVDSLNYAYYNINDKKSYVFDGKVWQLLAQDGKIYPSGINNGETAHWNGSEWVVDSFVTNTGKAVGIGTSTLYANNILTFKDGHLSSKQTVLPTIKFTNVSSSLSYKLDAGSTDTKGFINYTGSGYHLSYSTAKITVTFASSYETAPAVMIMPANKAIVNYVFYYVVSSTTGFDLYVVNESSSTISGGFQFYYFVIE